MSEDLRRHISNAYGMPEHLKEALDAWVSSVEARLPREEGDVEDIEGRLGSLDAQVASVEDRLHAVETAVADLHAALSSSPSPATVQRAVADVEMPAAED